MKRGVKLVNLIKNDNTYSTQKRLYEGLFKPPPQNGPGYPVGT